MATITARRSRPAEERTGCSLTMSPRASSTRAVLLCFPSPAAVVYTEGRGENKSNSQKFCKCDFWTFNRLALFLSPKVYLTRLICPQCLLLICRAGFSIFAWNRKTIPAWNRSVHPIYSLNQQGSLGSSNKNTAWEEKRMKKKDESFSVCNSTSQVQLW